MMARFTLVLGLAASLAAGCTPTYRVYVQAYSELSAPLGRGVPIGIATDSTESNPGLYNEIRLKVERLLQQDGYHVVPPDQAEYRLHFRAGDTPEDVLGYYPYNSYYWDAYGHGTREGPPSGLGYAAAGPYVGIHLNQWLALSLIQVKPGASDERKVVWVGQAATQTDRLGIRQAVDYLLVACLPRLGIDTHGPMVVSLREDDLRVQEMRPASSSHRPGE